MFAPRNTHVQEKQQVVHKVIPVRQSLSDSVKTDNNSDRGLAYTCSGQNPPVDLFARLGQRYNIVRAGIPSVAAHHTDCLILRRRSALPTRPTLYFGSHRVLPHPPCHIRERSAWYDGAALRFPPVPRNSWGPIVCSPIFPATSADTMHGFCVRRRRKFTACSRAWLRVTAV